MDTPQPEGRGKSKVCHHALLSDKEDETTVPYWDCIYCGAVAFFDPSKPGMLVPRES